MRVCYDRIRAVFKQPYNTVLVIIMHVDRETEKGKAFVTQLQDIFLLFRMWNNLIQVNNKSCIVDLFAYEPFNLAKTGIFVNGSTLSRLSNDIM